jgi:hypothetical protein
MTDTKFVPHVRTDVSRRTFIALSQGRKWDLYLAFQGGKVDVVKLDKEKSAALIVRPNEGCWSITNAIRVYTTSTMPKTTRAHEALVALDQNSDWPVQVPYADARPEGTDMDGPVLETAPAPAAKKAASKPEVNGNEVTLAQLCAELNVEPRIARRRLRAAQGLSETTRYVWDTTAVDLPGIKATILGAK